MRKSAGLVSAFLLGGLAAAQTPPSGPPKSYDRKPAWLEAENGSFTAPDLGFARIGAEVDAEAAKAAKGGIPTFRKWYASYARRLLPHSMYGMFDYGTDPERVRRRYRVLNAATYWIKKVRNEVEVLAFDNLCDEPYPEKSYMYAWYLSCGQMEYQPRLTRRLRAAFPNDIHIIHSGLSSWVGASKTLNPRTYLPLVDDMRRIEREHPSLRLTAILGLRIYGGWFAVDPSRQTHAELDRFCRRMIARWPKDKQKALVDYLNERWLGFDPICDRLKLPRFRFRMPSPG
ncbi:MAG: hypothetical protein MH204_08260 [Fimbriimonadaceae bacterium]|nr:hypothetical protein [Fimbriimonadaceae bacterium]